MERIILSSPDYLDEDSLTLPQVSQLTMTEAVIAAQNWPLWRLLAMSDATHSCVQARNDDDDQAVGASR